MTGNPVRQNLLGHSISREEAVRYLDLDPAKNNPHTGRQSWCTNHQPDFNRRFGHHPEEPRHTVHLANR